MNCKVCSCPSLFVSSPFLVLNRFSARLYRCQSCGFEFFNASNDWLAAAYDQPIANTDTGIVSRSLAVHRVVASFLGLSAAPGRILDWGSGSGLLVRLLRDDGYDCYGLEPYTSPVLAAAHTWSDNQVAFTHGRYRAIIAIEVVEHLCEPKEFFERSLAITDTLIFSTQLADTNIEGGEWWYYSRETGQHISFYTKRSLAYLAGLNGCKYAASRNKNLHIITKRPRDLMLFGWLAGQRRAQIIYPLAQALGKLRGRHSLVMVDHLAAKQALRSAQAKSSE